MIRDILLAARLMAPYYARSISALVPVEAPGLGTVGVDEYWRIYYDPAYLAGLEARQQGGLIAHHEVEHLLRRHAQRRGPRDPRRWNTSGDAEINDDAPLDALPPHGVYPASLGCEDGLMAEQYYEAVEAPSHACRCGSGAGGERLPCELEPGDAPALDDYAVERVIEATARDVRDYAARDPGTVPGHVVMWADAVLRPVRVPWPRLLASVMARLRAEMVRGRWDYTYQSIARRQEPGPGVLLPATTAYRPGVALIVDTSGSMGEEGAAVLGVVADIVRRSGVRIHETIEADATVQHRQRGSRPRVLGRGGGGTDMGVPLAAMSAVVGAAIVVTDGYTPWPDVAPAVPVVVVLVGGGDVAAPAWATTVSVA